VESLNNPVRLGEYIRFLRVKSGRTQEELADLCGLSKQTISTFERGQMIKFSTLCRIADVLEWEMIPDFEPVEEDVIIRRPGTNFQPGRDGDAARARMVAYWAKYDRCINPFCKAEAKMPCRKEHQLTRHKTVSFKACGSRKLLPVQEES